VLAGCALAQNPAKDLVVEALRCCAQLSHTDELAATLGQQGVIQGALTVVNGFVSEVRAHERTLARAKPLINRRRRRHACRRRWLWSACAR
jgi:hypothetical protein